MSDYPELHALFDGKDELELAQYDTLSAAIKEGLDASINQKANISALGAEIRKCIESLLFCPNSLESHPTAKRTLTTMFNAKRTNLEEVWYRVKVSKFPGGTAYMD